MKRVKTEATGRGAGGVDWEDVYRRMAAVTTALKGELSPGEKKRVLRGRAGAIARGPEKETVARECIEVVEFLVADERYAIETRYIREVYPLKELVTIPCTPAFVLGMTNVRGKIISVLDIRKFFDLPQKGLTELDKIIIVQDGDMELGIRADVVPGIGSIPLEELQPPLPTLTSIREKYLKGITGELVAVLDIGKLFKDPNIIVHEEVTA